MKTYRVVWLAVASMLAIVGISAALVLSPVALLYLSGVAGIGTILMVLAIGANGRPVQGDRSGQLITSGLAAGTAAGALVGLASLLGAGVFPLALCLLASSPYAVRAWNRWRRSRPIPSSAQPVMVDDAPAYTSPELPPGPALSEPARLTDEQLSRAWRASYRALEVGSSGIQMMDAVAMRQCFLDEFERRNSRGLAAWLASGARAAGNPLPYLAKSPVNRPAIDWDELTRGQDC